jgi:hypothetical protein
LKILTKEGASEFLGGKAPDAFVNELWSQLHLVGDAYKIPPDSGRKTALSRLFAHLLLNKASVCLYVSGWGIWPSAENLDLFYGYRRTLGETRQLIEAPFHVFESTENDGLVSILCMVLYFIWDAWVFDIEKRALIRISHDEWLEVLSSNDESIGEFSNALGKYGLERLNGPPT